MQFCIDGEDTVDRETDTGSEARAPAAEQGRPEDAGSAQLTRRGGGGRSHSGGGGSPSADPVHSERLTRRRRQEHHIQPARDTPEERGRDRPAGAGADSTPVPARCRSVSPDAH